MHIYREAFPFGRMGYASVLALVIFVVTMAATRELFFLFAKLGWTGTWLPRLVPAFFANAYDVFLLRQNFMSIPKELDKAAMLDGADPLRILTSVIIPQAGPAITAVAIFLRLFRVEPIFRAARVTDRQDGVVPGLGGHRRIRHHVQNLGGALGGHGGLGDGAASGDVFPGPAPVYAGHSGDGR
jgi:ABC-type glycerol-3-phosphate transport system permease component